MEDLLADFIAETNDGVTALESDLVHLERTPDDAECLARIFRVFHSMKGACGFLGLSALGAVVHDGEQILDELRNKHRPVDANSITDILNVTDRVRDLLPALVKRNQASRHLRIWSAGCAAGQEAYSLLMLLQEEHLPDWRIDIIGTDLSRNIIERARDASYSQFDIQRGLPVQMMLKYFTQNHERWQLHDDLRRRVSFQTQNLLSDFSHLGIFDVIFCRNVLLYMDASAKQDILRRMAANAHQETALILGASETLLQLNVPWRSGTELPNIYYRR